MNIKTFSAILMSNLSFFQLVDEIDGNFVKIEKERNEKEKEESENKAKLIYVFLN